MNDTESMAARDIGRLLVEDLLSRPAFMLYEVGDVRCLHYAEACAALGALRLAGLEGDAELRSRIALRYASPPPNSANHVDANVCGILPLELYIQTKDEALLKQGLALADGQWLHPLPSGMTRQTRFWIDDIYMIGILQVEAFLATGRDPYLERAALEIGAYLEKLQQPIGLFHHGPEAPFFWGRGNGWVAAGLAELLSWLPRTSPRYESIEGAYRKMMRALIEHQCESGMWRQLIDREESWEESSATAMFGYALRVGVAKGILPAPEFREAYENAWRALCARVTEGGKLEGICAGTGQSLELEYYLGRPRVSGDLHGQAAMLWFCHAIRSHA